MGEGNKESVEDINIFGDFYISPKDKIDDFASIQNELDKTKFNFINFEGPLFDKSNDNRISKTGPNLRQNKNSYRLLSKLNILNLCLSNNHILDYGEKGLKNSIDILTKNNFNLYGLANEENKSVKLCKKKIGIINVSEEEWQSHYSSLIQTDDIIRTSNVILKNKKLNDFNILIYHGGLEHQKYPSNSLIKKLSFYMDLGVDLICVHHSHCMSGIKLINNKKIYFGLGNFYFSEFNQHSNIGLGIKVSIKDNSLISDHFFVKNYNRKIKFINSSKREYDSLNKKFNSITEIINNKELLNIENNRIEKKLYQNYINYINPFYFPNRFIKNLNNFIFKSKVMLLYNLIKNESHREMLISALKKFLKK
tara:strand:+ start:933 stop:2030 length:1098 start_codon:yes stop_codon:yes gene_type:complete